MQILKMRILIQAQVAIALFGQSIYQCDGGAGHYDLCDHTADLDGYVLHDVVLQYEGTLRPLSRSMQHQQKFSC